MKTYEQFSKKSRVSYSCVLLNPESHQLLKNTYCNELSEDWKIYCHHMTICMGELPPDLKSRIGEEIEIETVKIGQDDKAFVVKVNPLDDELQTYYTPPKFPHVTLAVNTINNGKPFMSNKIGNWDAIENMKLYGRITEIKN